MRILLSGEKKECVQVEFKAGGQGAALEFRQQPLGWRAGGSEGL